MPSDPNRCSALGGASRDRGNSFFGFSRFRSPHHTKIHISHCKQLIMTNMLQLSAFIHSPPIRSLPHLVPERVPVFLRASATAAGWLCWLLAAGCWLLAAGCC
jgi:hypothetical protein